MRNRFLVVGVLPDGPFALSEELRQRIMSADLLVGGRRQLGYFSESCAERLPIEAELGPVVERLRHALDAGQRVVVLASGDPLCYGIGASLRRFFPAEALEMIAAPSSFQLAFAALAEPWHEAALLSAHGRALGDLLDRALAATVAAFLTDRRNTPAVIAAALIAAGAAAQSRCAICENLGLPEQRIVQTTLAEAAKQTYAELNVLVVWCEEARVQGSGFRVQGAENKEQRTQNKGPHPPAPAPVATGAGAGAQYAKPSASLRLCGADGPIPDPRSPIPPDEAYSTSAGQITKRELRLLCLAELGLGPYEVMWDIGAGSGAVAIEAARAQPSAVVYAVERRRSMCEHIHENMRRFPAPNLHLFEGSAPEVCVDWPDPQAVFIGGSGGQLEAIVGMVCRRMQSGGRLVISLATIEHLKLIRDLLPAAGIVQIQISRAVPIQSLTRFEALNPVFVATWRAPGADQ